MVLRQHPDAHGYVDVPDEISILAFVANWVRREELAWLKGRLESEAASYVSIYAKAEAGNFQLNDRSLRAAVTLLAMSVGVGHSDRRHGAGALDADELIVRTPEDISRILKRAMSRAELGCGQIATKTKINRSQIYNLIKADGALPHEPDQLLACLRACRMPLGQIDLVILQWRLLRERRRRGLSLELNYPEPTPGVFADVEPGRMRELHRIDDDGMKNAERAPEPAEHTTRAKHADQTKEPPPHTVSSPARSTNEQLFISRRELVMASAVAMPLAVLVYGCALLNPRTANEFFIVAFFALISTALSFIFLRLERSARASTLGRSARASTLGRRHPVGIRSPRAAPPRPRHRVVSLPRPATVPCPAGRTESASSCRRSG